MIIRALRPFCRLSGLRSLSFKMDFPRHFPIEQFADIKVKQDGKLINLYSYKQPATISDPKAVVVLLHGYAEYVGLSLGFYARALAHYGICSIGFDQRGFGRSQGIPGYIRSFDDIASDCKAFILEAKSKDPSLKDKPIFLLGYSMGGESTMYTALKSPELFKGMIMISPEIQVHKDLIRGMPILIKLIPLLRIFGKCGMFKFPMEKASNYPELVKLLMKDKLVYKDKVKVSTGISMIEGQQYIMQNASKLTTPYIVFHGETDHIVEIDAVKKLYNLTTNVKQKEFVILPGGEHDAAMLPDNVPKISKSIADWILKQI